MSKRIGRKYEMALRREVLEPLGCYVVDVHANSGLEGKYECDLLIEPDGDEDAALDDMTRCEAKYRGRANGFSKLYRAHLDTVGLGTTQALMWSDGVYTGGVLAYLAWCAADGTFELWEHDAACLNAQLRKWLDGVDVLAMRSRESTQWVFCWRIYAE